MRLFVLAFVLGTMLLQRAAVLPDAAPALAGLAALLAVRLARAPLARAGLLLAAGAFLGYGYAGWRAGERLAESLPVAWEGRDIAISGVVASLPQPGEKGTRFLFDVERVATPGATVPASIALTAYTEPAARTAPRLVPGERRSLVVRLKRPRGLANPHGFDFEPWALERDIRATGYVRSRLVPAGEVIDGWPYTLHWWRSQIRDAMQAHLAGARLRGVLVALAIGDQDAIAPDDWEVFWRTGVGHFMRITGSKKPTNLI